MRLDYKKTLLVLNFDKHQILTNTSKELLVDNFTLLTTFSPDIKYINKQVAKIKKAHPTTPAYVKMYVVAKSGQHQGLAFTAWQGDGDIVYSVEYEWWEKTDEGEFVKEMKVFLPEVKKDLNINTIIQKTDDKYIFSVDNQQGFYEQKSLEYNTLIDYKDSLAWIGAANRLILDDDRYDDVEARIYVGDISKIHIQGKDLSKDKINLFFEDYDKFKESDFDYKNDQIFFTTDFKEHTLHKVKDYSGNGLHLLVYNKHCV